MFFTNNLYNKGKSRVHIALTQSTTLHLTGEQNMIITDIKIRKVFSNDGPMKAVVSVTFDDALALHDIKVINTRDKYFIVMPSRKNPDGTFRDIVHPINSDFRHALEEEVLDAYFAEVKRIEEEGEAAPTEEENAD